MIGRFTLGVLLAFAAMLIAFAFIVGSLMADETGTLTLRSAPHPTAPGFTCPGVERNGVRVGHWYFVKVNEPVGKRRLMFAWCANGEVYWRHGPVQGPEKMRRYLTFVYHPKLDGPEGSWVTTDFAALIFTPIFSHKDQKGGGRG